MKLIPWAVAALFAAVAVFLIRTGRLDRDGKFLGVVNEQEGFGLDDLLMGLFVIVIAVLGGKLAHSVTGGKLPQGVKV